MNRNVRLLLDLASDLPDGLRGDWKGGNHYELTAPADDGAYSWLALDDMAHRRSYNDRERHGLLMEIAAVLKDAEPELKRLLDDE